MLERVKTLLAISDDTQDGIIAEIIANITARILGMIQEEELPSALTWIVVEASVNRYNRLASEGATSHTVEGESWSFADDVLDPYQDDIQAWLNAQEDKTIGKVRFI